jgi:hypothetical protein
MLFKKTFLGHLGTPKWTQKGTQRPASGQLVGGMYGPMTELKDKPLTKLLGPVV